MKLLLTTTIILSIGYLLICLLLYLVQERLIFFPDPLPANFDFSPYTAHDYEEIWLDRPQARIHGLFFPHDKPEGIVLYFHGNGGNLQQWVDVAPRFLERGYAVLITDYRGYGKSSGPLEQQALLDDAQAFYDYLTERFPGINILVYGRSLGTGFATWLAARNPVHRLMLETPYFSIQRISSQRFPWLPIRWLLRYPMPTNEFIREVTCPVHMIHGTRDLVILHRNSQALVKEVSHSSGYYVEIEGGTHHNLDTYAKYDLWLNNALN